MNTAGVDQVLPGAEYVLTFLYSEEFVYYSEKVFGSAWILDKGPKEEIPVLSNISLPTLWQGTVTP